MVFIVCVFSYLFSPLLPLHPAACLQFTLSICLWFGHCPPAFWSASLCLSLTNDFGLYLSISFSLSEYVSNCPCLVLSLPACLGLTFWCCISAFLSLGQPLCTLYLFLFICFFVSVSLSLLIICHSTSIHVSLFFTMSVSLGTCLLLCLYVCTLVSVKFVSLSLQQPVSACFFDCLRVFISVWTSVFLFV